jgi:hypothetical protein
MKIRARVTDLLHDGFGWSENASWAREVVLDFPDDASDLTIARAVKRSLGIQGMRKDYWAGDDLSWRDGCIGAYAMVCEGGEA